MIRGYRRIIAGLSANRVGTAGVALTTSSFLLFLFLEALRLLGVLTNAYAGLVTYMTLPALFLLGLALIPIGWRIYRRSREGRGGGDPARERFGEEMTRPRRIGSRLVATIAVLTLVNILFLGAGGARMLHFMDEPVFCGTACHSVMHPEWTTYQASPHARVKCVECHVGEGADALIDSKLNGLWQILSVTFDLYERPIPTPVRQLRPAQETCERCHWPDKFYGDRIRVFPRRALDRLSTPLYSALSLKVGSGRGDRRGEIHWHVAERNEIRYAAAEESRERIAWVEVRKGDDFWRYENRALHAADTLFREERVFDCVDCHNRATHIYENPERAVDRRIHEGDLDPALPWLKREALAALTGAYGDSAAAMTGIENAVNVFYLRGGDAEIGLVDPAAVERTVEVLREVRRRNIHPRMRVDWNVYPDHRGHRDGVGCFRCHNPRMTDAYGAAVPYDCTLCHSILSFESAEPFRFLRPADDGDPERAMHEFLREEFLQSWRR